MLCSGVQAQPAQQQPNDGRAEACLSAAALPPGCTAHLMLMLPLSAPSICRSPLALPRPVRLLIPPFGLFCTAPLRRLWPPCLRQRLAVGARLPSVQVQSGQLRRSGPEAVRLRCAVPALRGAATPPAERLPRRPRCLGQAGRASCCSALPATNLYFVLRRRRVPCQRRARRARPGRRTRCPPLPCALSRAPLRAGKCERVRAIADSRSVVLCAPAAGGVCAERASSATLRCAAGGGRRP